MVKLLGTEAPAKINLFLRVTGRRPDGYHELDSIFLPLALSDRVGLTFRPSSARAVLLRCDWPGLGPDVDLRTFHGLPLNFPRTESICLCRVFSRRRRCAG
jgi:hypothetical protein